MTPFARQLAFSAAAACFALALGSSPALAKTHHHRHHAKAHHARPYAKSGAIVRIAQGHLSNLGYYSGRIDGIMGPKTRGAIKRFQHEHGLKADGILGRKTNHALEAADPQVSKEPSFMTHEVVVNSDLPVNPDYVPSLNGGTKTMTSRFATVDVSENGVGTDKQYNVNLNGHPLLTANSQSSIIGISPVYDMGDEESIVFTTYNADNNVCAYGNYVLVLNSVGSKMLDIENCTRNYQARVDNGSLYVSFPERDDKRDVGAVWRVQGTSIEKL